MVSCARVGAPVGGKKDTLAPKFLGSNIDTTRVRVSTQLKELRLDFDEYVILKDVNKNLLITPEIKKIKKIIPSNLATKSVTIQWEDALKENTTYNFNFGNAITDFNEGNILPYFNFAFSTGDKLDELFISGTVDDGMVFKKKNQEPKENKRVVGLYAAAENTDFRKKPQYVAKVDEENYFEINYLQKGDYYLLAFEDDNQNGVFDSGKEKAAFLKDKITLDQENIRGLKLLLFPSKKQVKYVDYKAQNGGILLNFEGHPEKVNVQSVEGSLQDYKVLHQKRSDSVAVWFTPEKNGFEKNTSKQLKLSYDADGRTDTISISYKAVKQEFTLSNKRGNELVPDQAFRISASLPLANVNQEKWKLESDSTSQNFTAKILPTQLFEIEVNAQFLPGKKYALTIPKESISSFYTQNDKAYRFEFEVGKPENYGSFKVNLKNVPKEKFWIELLDNRGDIQYQKYINASLIEFKNLKPGEYTARIRVDENENGYWDEADFSTRTQAEKVFIFSKEINVRPLWIIEENWELNQ